MSIPKSRQAYGDCYEVMDKALADEVGVRVQFETKEEATFFRMRMHTARAITRRDNARVYEEDHPMYNASAHDALIARIVVSDDEVWLHIERTDVLPGKIESLSGAQQDTPPSVEELYGNEAEMDGFVEPEQPRIRRV